MGVKAADVWKTAVSRVLGIMGNVVFPGGVIFQGSWYLVCCCGTIPDAKLHNKDFMSLVFPHELFSELLAGGSMCHFERGKNNNLVSPLLSHCSRCLQNWRGGVLPFSRIVCLAIKVHFFLLFNVLTANRPLKVGKGLSY